MNYREAKKIQVGDIVVDYLDHRHRVRRVENIAMAKRVEFQFEDTDVLYAHTAIRHIESADVKHKKYYMILSFNHEDDIDETCYSHIYPSYVSCMNLKGGYTKPSPFESLAKLPLMLQSNPNDGLKFIDERNVYKMLERAKFSYPQKEFKIIEMDAMVFGRAPARWVIDL